MEKYNTPCNYKPELNSHYTTNYTVHACSVHAVQYKYGCSISRVSAINCVFYQITGHLPV